MSSRAAIVLTAGALCCSPAPAPVSDGLPGGADYREEIEAHRAEREERLLAEDGWLTLVGLHWLEGPSTTLGSAADSGIVLPADAAPALAAVLSTEAAGVRISARPDAGITVDGVPVGERLLADDAADSPDTLRLGRLRMHVIRRGGRYALRVKDPESPVRTSFAELDFYPIAEEFRVVARLERYPEPKRLEVATVLGTTTPMWSPGRLRFEIAGRALGLEPLVTDPTDTELFLIFKDQTSGSETYGAGRYLYADLEGDTAVVDFNRAHNPPCAFTRFATCPLPPPSNRLAEAIRAGEKSYAGH